MEEMVTEEFKADKNLKYSEKLKRQGQCNVLITRSFIADVYKAALAKDIIFLDLAKAKGLL